MATADIKSLRESSLGDRTTFTIDSLGKSSLGGNASVDINRLRESSLGGRTTFSIDSLRESSRGDKATVDTEGFKTRWYDLSSYQEIDGSQLSPPPALGSL